jgi:hypothetical protein
MPFREAWLFGQGMIRRRNRHFFVSLIPESLNPKAPVLTVQTIEHGTLIVLSKPFDTQAKALYLAYSIVFGAGS